MIRRVQTTKAKALQDLDIKNMRFFSFIITLLISIQVFSQNTVGKIEIEERKNEPVKRAELFFKYDRDSIIYQTKTDDKGCFFINIDLKEVNIIELHHPFFGLWLVYEKKYSEPLIIQNDTLFIELPTFNYITTYPGEAKYYTDVDEFLSEKYSKCLDLKNQQLESVPKLKKIKEHGVEALFLENNNISQVTEELFKIKNLKYVDLSGNPLNSCSLALINEWSKKGILIIY